MSGVDTPDPLAPEAEPPSDDIETIDETPVELRRVLSGMASVSRETETWKGRDTAKKLRRPDVPDADFMKALATDLVKSESYRDSLRRRILKDELPSGVETALLYLFAGKPKEMVEVTGKNGGAIVTEVVRRVIRPKEQSA